jgi:hypothetical protein
MFNKKTQQQGTQDTKRAGRTRVDTLNGQPKLQNVRMLLVEAERNRGALVELPINVPNGMFLLSCQADHLSTEPCWTLYEGLDGNRQIWSYMNNDLEMICDIVNMSITEKSGGAETASAFNDVNAVLSNELKNTEAKPWGQFSQSTQNSWETAAAPAPAPAAPAAPAPTPAPEAWPSDPAAPQTQQWPGAAAAPTPGGWPEQQNAQWPAAPPAGMPQPQQQPPWQDPNTQWNHNPAAPQGWPNQPAAPAPAAPAAPYVPQPAPAPAPSDWPSPQTQPAAGANPWINSPAAAAPAAGGGGSVLKFLTLLEGKPNITIGEVLFLSDIPPSCVDSAMRLQEMVCKSEISDKTAVEALKIAAQRGTGVVDESVLGELRSRNNAAAESSRAAITLLKDSGLLTEADVTAAESASLAQNKDVGEVLIAGGKTDKLILDAAIKCTALISDAKIRSDQAIIALHYCVRARAPIEQAFEDLSIDV